MFCPKCGNPDQSAETYCRQCGTFQPDLSKPVKKETKPEEHIKVNSVLSLMTVIVSLTLAILIYVFVGSGLDTRVLNFVTAGLLLAISGWHIQTFIRTRKLKKQLKRRVRFAEADSPSLKASQSPSTSRILTTADFTDIVPPSVTERTTKHLADPQKRST